MTSPSPLVTDYLEIGGLPSAMLNAGACGMACWLFMVGLKGDSRPSTLAGYFLVVAHCFYGLNFLTMWPCFLAPFLYLHLKKLDFKNNLHVCMFTTSFGPFIGELLFRYTQKTFTFGHPSLTVSGVLLTIAFSISWVLSCRPFFRVPTHGTKATTYTTAAWPSDCSVSFCLTFFITPWESIRLPS